MTRSAEVASRVSIAADRLGYYYPRLLLDQKRKLARVSPRMARWTPAQHEPALLRPQRRAGGVYYTPSEIVRFICRRTLGPLSSAGSATSNYASKTNSRILDPACGAGAFLIEAARTLIHQEAAQPTQTSADGLLARVKQSLFGIDIDPSAVAQCRMHLARAIAGQDANEAKLEQLAAELATNVIHADALLDELPQVFAASPFDLVLGNPPYVNIRQLVKQHGPEYVLRLRERYATATGHFDLYVLFVERAFELLCDGGQCAYIVPNKIAGLGYAAQCRLMLLEQTQLDLIADLSASRVFAAAGVYPWIVAWTKRKPEAAQRLQWITAKTSEQLESPNAEVIEQSTLQADGFRRRDSSSLASNALCQPLGTVATIQCGTAGYMATRIAACLREASEGIETNAQSDSRQVDFIVSGNIDRYRIEPGDVRYLGLRYQRPQLSLTDSALTARQRRLFAQRKIVLGGMTRRLEAAYDSAGLALGVQVYAVIPPAADLYYVLGLLNSRWLSFWFREQFAAKQLASGYLGINKAQLTQLPIRVVAGSERADRRRRRALAEAAEALSADPSPLSTVTTELDRRIDELVYELYRLTPAEISQCETHFAPVATRSRRAA